VDYLSTLRNNRPARPLGSRPLPFKASTTSRLSRDPPARSESALCIPPQHLGSVTALPEINDSQRSTSALSFHQQESSSAARNPSARSRTNLGRPPAGDPEQKSYSIRGRKVSPTAVVEAPVRSPSANYRESGARWIERQEAISLRGALEEMDHRSEEQQIHAAAQDEAADLVWRHRNPSAAEGKKHAAYANPDMHSGGRHRYTAHLQKGAYARSQSQPCMVAEGTLPKSNSFGSTSGYSRISLQGNDSNDRISTNQVSKEDEGQSRALQVDPKSKLVASETTEPMVMSSHRKSSAQRRPSNGSRRYSFPNPSDQIYEDSGNVSSSDRIAVAPTTVISRPLRTSNRNSQLQGARPLPGAIIGPGEDEKTPVERFEIHKNPPSQSRSAGYTRNPVVPSIDVIPEVETPPSKNGMELRGEDIRAATSMRLKDRSPKLPIPTAVSDRPGRPIVSFDRSWRPHDAIKAESHEAERPGPKPTATVSGVSVSAPIVPTINVSGLEESPGPTIVVPEVDSVPVITICTDESSSKIKEATSSSKRPLPQPSRTVPAKLPAAAKTTSRLPWLSPASRAGVPTATCANCSLPISGRVVTASGAGSSSLKALFHPECFTCHHCSTALECVAFYPEPEDKRMMRVEAAGLSDHNLESELRFYCHLDFHEFFSPRCRSCKTPIEGEVIVAAGSEWHIGHFFCAECGDPFDSSTPFVEKDNYAYCVSCHTRRTSARCRACKNQILDELTVQALGGQWHAECFNCYECGGGFGDDGRFFVRDVTMEATEKEKRKGLATRMEERAVCEACEGRRLKA
jgi:LIM domain